MTAWQTFQWWTSLDHGAELSNLRANVGLHTVGVRRLTLTWRRNGVLLTALATPHGEDRFKALLASHGVEVRPATREERNG